MHASESCSVYSYNCLIRFNRVGITSTLSIDDGDTGRYLSIESVTAYWWGTERSNPFLDCIVEYLLEYQIHSSHLKPPPGADIHPHLTTHLCVHLYVDYSHF